MWQILCNHLVAIANLIKKGWTVEVDNTHKTSLILSKGNIRISFYDEDKLIEYLRVLLFEGSLQEGLLHYKHITYRDKLLLDKYSEEEVLRNYARGVVGMIDAVTDDDFY